jgi:hypothetical protein
MSKLKRYNDFYLKSKGLSNQNKKAQLQEISNKLFESRVKRGGNLDLIEVLLEKEAYKDGKLNESLSIYLMDEDFKQNLRFNSCAGFISEGIADLKSKSLKYLKDNGISEVEYELVDRNFDILYLGDDKIVEGFLKWVGSSLASALAPVMDYILKPGWKSLRFVGSKMFGEETMKKIELMGQKIIDKITGVFDRIDQKFQNVLDKTWSGIKSIAQKIGDFLKSFWELCKKVFNKIWEFIKGLASSAFGSISKNPRLSRLKNTLNKAESSEAKAGALESEVTTYYEHIKRFFGLLKEGPAAIENQKSEIDNSASQTFNPEGNTEVKVEESSTSFQYQVNLVCDSLLWELKSNKDFRPEDLVNMNESHDEGVSLSSVKNEGPAGELAVSIFNRLEKTKSLLKSKDKEAKEVIDILNNLKKSSEKSGVDYKEVSKHIEELFKSLKNKRISKWCIDRLGNYEDSKNQESIQKLLKELGFLYDPLVDMNDEQKEISNKLWKEIDYSSHSGRFEKLKQIMQNWSADDYKLFNKQAAYKLKIGEIKKSKTGEPSLSVAFKSKAESPAWNREFQKFLFEEKNSKKLGDDFIVDEFLKSSEETKDIWSKFSEIWNDQGGRDKSGDLEKLLVQIEEPKVYDELDKICRQELGFSLKKKIKEEFSGTFTREESKKRIENIIKHFAQEKFAETNIKSEESAEESGFIKKWCQNAVSFLISPFGKLVELIVQGLGKMVSNLPGCGVGYSWQSMSNTFKILPEIFAVLAGIAVDAICTTKGIGGMFGHKAGEAHPEPEGFFNILGARVKHSAELALGKENVEGALKAVGGGETHHESKNTIKNYKQFINESKSRLIIESSEKEEEHKSGFDWKSIAALGTGMLMSYVANLFSVSFPVVGIVLEGISVILLIFHLLDILRNDAPKWFGKESQLNGLTSFANKTLGWVGLGH